MKEVKEQLSKLPVIQIKKTLSGKKDIFCIPSKINFSLEWRKWSFFLLALVIYRREIAVLDNES